jgi:hypothetical protein
MRQKGLGDDTSLSKVIKELDGVIDWLFICGVTKSMGISYVVAESTRTTYVSTKSMGANCASKK